MATSMSFCIIRATLIAIFVGLFMGVPTIAGRKFHALRANGHGNTNTSNNVFEESLKAGHGGHHQQGEGHHKHDVHLPRHVHGGHAKHGGHDSPPPAHGSHSHARGGAVGSNPIDSCWRSNNWISERKSLANCGIGFGANALGGRDGEYYVVTDSGDDPVNPAPGTLRYGVVQEKPLWIYFARDMTIRLKNELIVSSHKTIDGRGSTVRLGEGSPCLTIQYVTNVIIESLYLENCRASSPGRVKSNSSHTGHRGGSDGDAINIYGSRDIWIDHNMLSKSADGLTDVTHGSSLVTISNNFYHNHDKVMLLGHNDQNLQDRDMLVTIAYNTFGPNLIQRMPRCRLGMFHVMNNDYQGWEMYAIGGSANPTILSEGNRFSASSSKMVTKREGSKGLDWTWKSANDIFKNGAKFQSSGSKIPNKLKSSRAGVALQYSLELTSGAGPIVHS